MSIVQHRAATGGQASTSAAATVDSTHNHHNPHSNGGTSKMDVSDSSHHRKRPTSKTKKKASPYTKLIIWAIGMLSLFMGVVNYAHNLNVQGNLPSGIKLTIDFGHINTQFAFGSSSKNGKNNVNRDASSFQKKKRSLKGGGGGGEQHYLPPPPNLQANGKPKLNTNKRQVTTLTRQAAISPETMKYYQSKPRQQQYHSPAAQGRTVMKKYENALQLSLEQDKHAAKRAQPVDADELARLGLLAKRALESERIKAIQNKEKEKGGNVFPIDHFLALSEQEGHDKERILKLIKDNAGLLFLSETTYQELPTWSHVTAMYGTQPRLVGLEDQCPKFKQDGELAEKFLAVAGMFNSGTNFLAKTLIRNCVLHKRQEKYGIKNRGIRWQVPYGKHSPPKDNKFREEHVAQKSEGVEARNVLPAVMIRDPFRWLQSMCSHHYTCRWPRVFSRKDPRYHCPNLYPTAAEKLKLQDLGRNPLEEGTVMASETENFHDDPTGHKMLNSEFLIEEANEMGNADEDGEEQEEEEEEDGTQPQQQAGFDETSPLKEDDLSLHHFPVRVKYKNFTRHHFSLVHLYNEWYQEYLDLLDYPRIFVRMEDLLFFPDEVVPQICECAGGRLVRRAGEDTGEKATVKLTLESAKMKHSKKFMEEGQDHTGYLDALIKYGTATTRYRGLTPHDVQYAR